MPSKRKPSRLLLILFIGIIIIMGILAIWWQPHQNSMASQPPELVSGTLLPPGRGVGPFALRDEQNQSFSDSNLRGHWSLVTFGFTHCPDICPLILNTLRQVHAQLEQTDDIDVNDIQVVFVSLDPRRDTPEILNQFVTAFNPDFKGVTGSEPQIALVASQLGVPYLTPEASSDDEYDVQHSGVVVLLNPAGEYQAVFSFPQQSDLLAQDVIEIVHYYS